MDNTKQESRTNDHICITSLFSFSDFSSHYPLFKAQIPLIATIPNLISLIHLGVGKDTTTHALLLNLKCIIHICIFYRVACMHFGWLSTIVSFFLLCKLATVLKSPPPPLSRERIFMQPWLYWRVSYGYLG